MKLCFVIGAMNYSGAEKVLSIITSELEKAGENISIILLDKKSGIREKENDIDIYGAKANSKINRWRNIKKCILRIKPDVVVSFGSVCNVNTIVAMLGIKIPLVVCERNDPYYDPRKKIKRVERNILYRYADAYVFQTDRIKEYFNHIIQRKKYDIIPNPLVNTGNTWNIHEVEKKIVTVARLDDYQKRHLLMMDSFKEFHTKHPDYILEIYGDGPDKDKYIDYIRKHNMDSYIKLKGKINNPENVLKKSAVFLLTSRFEGMPNALIEAMSVGVPCVSVDCGGGGARSLFEMCENGGILVENAEKGEISTALLKVIENPKIQIELSQNALKVNELLDKRKVVNEWRNFLKKLIE